MELGRGELKDFLYRGAHVWDYGGGYQYPKAVLDAIGKRYVVEAYKTDDGFGGYTLYSDGYCEQYGVEILEASHAGKTVDVVLFKPYNSEKFNVVVSVFAGRTSLWGWGAQAKPINESSFRTFIGGVVGEGVAWETRGYIA